MFDASCDSVKLATTSLNCLMYADDLVILSSSETGLQSCLTRLHSYCIKWHLSANMNKTKILIFRRNGRKLKAPEFLYGNQKVDIEEAYCYLGLTLTSNGDFKEAMQLLLDKATKASFSLSRALGNHNHSVNVALKLYESTVKPVLLYGSEVWGAFSINFEKLLCDTEGKTKLYDAVSLFHWSITI